MFPSREFALEFATTRSRCVVLLDPAHYSRGAVSLFLSFFAACLRSLVFWICGVTTRASKKKKKKRIERERERKKRKRRPEFGNKTDDSPRDARDSSARRTIFGSRALPLSLLRWFLIILVSADSLSSHTGTLAHLFILYIFSTTKQAEKKSAKMSSSTAMYASLSILSLCALTGTGVAIGSGVGMMSMAALEADKKQTVAAHSVKEKSWVESKQVSGSSARGFAAAGRQ
jgi:hypothetical protein